MNILCVASYYKPAYVYGGPAYSIPLLCEAMVKAGAHVTVFTTDANGPGKSLNVPLNRPVQVEGVKVYYYPLSQPLARVIPFYSRALDEACIDNIAQFDVVYVPGSWTYTVMVGARSAAKAGIPYVMSPRGNLMDWPMHQKRLKKRLYLALVERGLIDNAAAIHVTCSMEQQHLQKWRFHPPTVTIPNGISIPSSEVLPERGRLRDSLGIPQTGTVSLYSGRLHKTKRVSLTVDAFAGFARERSDAHLLFVGPDEDGSGQRAAQQARELGLSNQVHFAGLLRRNELIQAYIDADVLVLLSYTENFGMVVAESMAVGLPVLLSEEVGLAGEVEEADAGRAVPATPDRVRMAWQELLADPDLREAMGKRGMSLVQERFSVDVVADRMLEMFAAASTEGCGNKLETPIQRES